LLLGYKDGTETEANPSAGNAGITGGSRKLLPPVNATTISLIVRLADRHLVGRHRVGRRRPASRARAASVHVPVSRDPPLGLPVALDRRTYPVRLDYVLFP
jgi:hypothetical protein